MTPPPAEVQAATLQRFLDAWKAWDPEAWIGTFDDDFTQVTMPFSMQVPAKTKPEVKAVLPELCHVVEDYELTIHDVVHDANRNKAAVYALSKGKSHLGPWNMEYSVFVTFNEAGDKVARVEEMMDSAFMQQFGPKFGEYLAQKHASQDP